jgi:hypothetical protein
MSRQLLVSVPCLLALGLVLDARADDRLPERARAAAVERGGLGPALFTRTGKLRKGASDEAKVELSPGTCVVATLATSRGEAGLELLGDEVMLSDSDLGDVARLRYCAGQAQEELKLRVTAEERAHFAVGVFAVESTLAVAGAPPQAAPAALELPAPPPPPPLDAQLAALAARALPAYAAMTAPREEDLDLGDPRRREVVLEAGHCYRALAVGERAVGAIVLDLMGGRQGRVAPQVPPLETSGEGAPAARSDFVCAARTGPHPLEVRIVGSGTLVWQLFGATDPRSSWRWVPGGEGEGVAAHQVRTQRDRHAPGQSGVTPFVTRALRTAEHLDASFEVVAGKCYVAVGAGVPSLRALELELYDQRGSQIERISASGEPAVTRGCAVVNGRWRVRLRAYKGYGEAGLQVFGGA